MNKEQKMKLSASIKKHIRREKARLRREFFDEKKYKEMVDELYEKFNYSPKSSTAKKEIKPKKKAQSAKAKPKDKIKKSVTSKKAGKKEKKDKQKTTAKR